MHITLRFIGDLSAVEQERVCKATTRSASRFLPTSLGIGGLGAFPNANRPRVVWATVTEGADFVASVHRELEAELGREGVQAEKARYIAHVTLARVRDSADRHQLSAVREGVVSCPAKTVAGFQSSGITVMESILGRGKTVYRSILHARFGG